MLSGFVSYSSDILLLVVPSTKPPSSGSFHVPFVIGLYSNDSPSGCVELLKYSKCVIICKKCKISVLTRPF